MDTDSKIALRALLGAASFFSAVMAFFMAWELLPVPYSLLFAALVCAAGAVEFLKLPRPPRVLINGATVLVLVALLARVRLNYAVEALMEALLVMMAVKLLEEKNARDYVQIAGLNLATIVTTAMLSVEKSFVLYILGTSLATTLILTLATGYSRVPAARVTRQEALQIGFRVLALFMGMLPLCLLLFLAAPRAQSPIFGSRGGYGSALTGFSEQVSLGDVGNIQASNQRVFRAEMPFLENRTPYWRGLVLDLFDGRSWIASRRRADRSPFLPDPAAPQIRQEIFLEPGNRPYLFALDQPLALANIQTDTFGDGVFPFLGRNTGQRLHYSAVSTLSSRMRPTVPEVAIRRSLALPPDPPPRLRALVAEITRGQDREGIVRAIMDYLAPPNFSYALEGLPRTADALQTFLFETRRGNCEYFAAAAGVLLRMSGVPARLIAGYKGGQYNTTGGYYVVEEQNAHVWVEVWDDAAKEWVRHDPTPPGFGPETLAGPGLWEQYLDYLDYRWMRLVVNYDWEAQGNLFARLRELVRNPRALLTPTREGLVRMADVLAPSLGVALLCLVAVAGLFRLWRFRSGGAEKILLRRFLRVMRRHGYDKRPSEGLEEFLQRVDDEKLRLLAAPFVYRFEAFYYRDRPMDDATLKALRGQIDRVAEL